MQVLGIDAATAPSSIALWGLDGEAIHHRTGPSGRRTDAWILTAVDALLGEAGIDLTELDLVAATAGPGAFTGIRVGLATAMGLARGADVPIAGLGTLETMIDALRRDAPEGPSRAGLACIDARRGEVYVLLSPLESTSGPTVWGPAARRPDAVVDRLRSEATPPLATGSGLEAYPEIAALSRPVPSPVPLAVAVARRGAEILGTSGREGLPPPRPRYLRAPDARPGKNPLVEGGRRAPPGSADR